MAKYTFLLLSVVLTIMACTAKQEPIRYGFDSCDNCKMLIMDPKFGSVLLTKKGKNIKFDDTNCLAAYLHANFKNEDAVASISVIDFYNPETLIDATKAHYVQSPKIKSPMASGIAAFSTAEKAKEFLMQNEGTDFSWNDIKANFK